MKIAVVEAGDGRSSTWLGLARSLAIQGIQVLRLSPHSWYSSKSCQTQLSPNVHSDPEAFLAYLLTLGQHLTRRTHEKPVLFPSSDDGLSVIARNFDLLQRYYEPVASSWPVIQSIIDKHETYQLAHSLQLPFPKTYTPQSLADVHWMKREINYPCLLKPRMSNRFWPRFQVKLFKIESPTELVQYYCLYPTVSWLIQEEVPGPDDCIYTLRTVLNKASQPIAIHVTQKLRQCPPHFGIGAFAQSVWQPHVIRQGLRLLQALGFYGVASVEFKHDRRTNDFKLLDINGRSGTMTYLSTLCGVNTPYLAYCEASGLNPPPKDPTQCDYELGRIWIHLRLDLVALLQRHATRDLTLTQWLRSLLYHPRSYAIFSWNDPRPFLSEIWHALSQFSQIRGTKGSSARVQCARLNQ